jgi:hypothetical protein
VWKSLLRYFEVNKNNLRSREFRSSCTKDTEKPTILWSDVEHVISASVGASSLSPDCPKIECPQFGSNAWPSSPMELLASDSFKARNII